MRIVSAVLALVLMAATVLAPATARAEESDLTAQLQAAVAKLNKEQQAALLLLLSGSGAPAASPEASPEQSARAALDAALKQFESAASDSSFSLESFYAYISEDFKHPVVGNKAGARGWLDQMAPMLVSAGKSLITISVDDVEIEMEGDTAIAYPVDIDTPIGSVAAEVSAKREKDGVWRIVGVDGV
jgi:hypothetical protein